jgi:hypothetical protein
MQRRYDSFLLRCWQHDGVRRTEVEHLQSGGRIRMTTPAEAASWIEEQCDPSFSSETSTRTEGTGQEVSSQQDQQYPREMEAAATDDARCTSE